MLGYIRYIRFCAPSVTSSIPDSAAPQPSKSAMLRDHCAPSRGRGSVCTTSMGPTVSGSTTRLRRFASNSTSKVSHDGACILTRIDRRSPLSISAMTVPSTSSRDPSGKSTQTSMESGVTLAYMSSTAKMPHDLEKPGRTAAGMLLPQRTTRRRSGQTVSSSYCGQSTLAARPMKRVAPHSRTAKILCRRRKLTGKRRKRASPLWSARRAAHEWEAPFTKRKEGAPAVKGRKVPSRSQLCPNEQA
jgi:hypothetical protein